MSREQLRKAIMKNVAKREPRTGAQIAERIDPQFPARGLSRVLGDLLGEGLIVKGKGRPPTYVKA